MMPAYDYRCPECGQVQEVCKPMSNSYVPFCLDCGELMVRVYAPSQVRCRVSDYSRALGIDLANRGAVDRMKREHHDRTGGRLVEVGNESLAHIRRPGPDWDAVANAARMAA